MKYSIIVPVFNEEIIIKNTLNKLCNLNYDKKNYEIVVVDDCSTDNTYNVIKNIKSKYKNINFQIVRNESNLGRVLTREKGASFAKSKTIVFIDSRCLPDKNILKDLDNYVNKYNAIVGNAYINPERSWFDRLSYLINLKLYKPYFGIDFEDLIIDAKNFDISPKGTGVFCCDKEIFLTSQIKNKYNKNVSDDTKLLRNIMEKTKVILKTSKMKVQYLNRTSFKSNIKHIYQRGPKFIDYYHQKGKKYYNLLNLFLLLILFTTITIFFVPKLIFLYIIGGFFLLLIFSAYLSKNFKDFLIGIIILPFIISSFGLGLIKGFILKLFRRL